MNPQLSVLNDLYLIGLYCLVIEYRMHVRVYINNSGFKLLKIRTRVITIVIHKITKMIQMLLSFCINYQKSNESNYYQKSHMN